MAGKSVIIALASGGLPIYFCFRKLIDTENSSSYSTVQCPEYRPESFLNKSFEKLTTYPQSTFYFFNPPFFESQYHREAIIQKITLVPVLARVFIISALLLNKQVIGS